ncbi:MAG: hypothetical protein EP343_22870 [Deltaproteobacteria bacterium]|nr:MAG: hypothetical protein EP343_22870 [Deltaproteobacteria bacterium]
MRPLLSNSRSSQSLRWTLGFGLMLLVGLSSSMVWAFAGSVPVWTRRAGDYTNARRPLPLNKRSIHVATTAQVAQSLYDVQYKKTMHYRGIFLSQLLKKYKIPKGVDTALLRFRNGMVVPYPLIMLRAPILPVFVAFSRWSNSQKQWLNTFPLVSKKTPYFYRDIRPIRFRANKVVVSRSWHPSVKGKLSKEFSVWRHVDSLQGIELVNGAAYERQFAVANTSREKRGAVWFRQSCQFCHGARDVGASYGWDFVTPMPIYKYRRSARLYLHIKFRTKDAARKGLMMPALRSMTMKEASFLWNWLRAIATRKMNPYQPNAKKIPKSPSPW